MPLAMQHSLVPKYDPSIENTYEGNMNIKDSIIYPLEKQWGESMLMSGATIGSLGYMGAVEKAPPISEEDRIDYETAVPGLEIPKGTTAPKSSP